MGMNAVGIRDKQTCERRSALVVWVFSFQGTKEPQKCFQQHASGASTDEPARINRAQNKEELCYSRHTNHSPRATSMPPHTETPASPALQELLLPSQSSLHQLHVSSITSINCLFICKPHYVSVPSALLSSPPLLLLYPPLCYELLTYRWNSLCHTQYIRYIQKHIHKYDFLKCFS